MEAKSLFNQRFLKTREEKPVRGSAAWIVIEFHSCVFAQYKKSVDANSKLFKETDDEGLNKNTYEIKFCDLSSAPPPSWWQIWLYLSFPDDTDIPLRRLPLADSSKQNAWALPRSSMGRIRSFYSVKKVWRNRTHFVVPMLLHPTVISTAAKRSGEISHFNSTHSIVAGDLSTQSFKGVPRFYHL